MISFLVLILDHLTQKGHVSYCHHLAPVVVVRRRRPSSVVVVRRRRPSSVVVVRRRSSVIRRNKLFQKSSPLKVLEQWKLGLNHH